MTLDFINVGYGDAILIRSAGFAMLVDCGDMTVGDGGPDSQRISAADFLRREGVETLDLLVLTHLHRDHSGGLTELLKTVRVKKFLCNYLPPQDFWGRPVPVPSGFSAGARCLLGSLNIFLVALSVMEQQGTDIALAVPGPLALCPHLSAEAFLEAPPIFDRQRAIWQNVLEGRADNGELDELDGFINNTSIRLRLTCGETTVELPGDMYADCWEKHDIPACTLVKLPHHGHWDSITPRLLDMLAPREAVISVSNSRTDDCPAASVIRMVREKGCRLHITDSLRTDDLHTPAHNSVRFLF